jgi:uncharacterized protein YdcH (DUF465 family)/soluble cytochrome b562
MALTQQDKNFLDKVVSKGATPEEAIKRLKAVKTRQAEMEAEASSPEGKIKSAFSTQPQADAFTTTPKSSPFTTKAAEGTSGQMFQEGDKPGNIVERSVLGAQEGLVQGVEKAKERVGTRKALIEEMPTDTFGQKLTKLGAQALNIPASGADVAFRPALGAVEGVAGAAIEPVITGAMEKLSPEQRQTLADFTTAISEDFAKLPPGVQEVMRSAGLGLEVGTLGVGKEVVEEVGEQALKQTGKAITKGIDVAEEGIEKGIQAATTSLQNLKNAAPEIGTVLERPRVSAEIAAKDKWQDVKNVLVGLDQNLVPILNDIDEDLAKEFFDTAKAFDADVRNITPDDLRIQKMQEGFDVLNEKIKDTGSLIGQARQKIATVRTNPTEVQSVIDKMKPVLETKGYTISEGKLKALKGREPILTKTEVAEANNILAALTRAKQDPNFQRLLDNRIKLDKNIQFKKKQGEISDNLDVLSQVAREELRGILEKQVGKLEADRVEAFAELKNALDEIAGKTSKGENIDKFMNRLLSERGGINKEVAAMFEEATGVSPINLAVLSDLSRRTIKSSKAKPLLTQRTIGDTAAAPGLIGKASKLGGVIIDVANEVIPLGKILPDIESQTLAVIKNKKARQELIKRLEALSSSE